MKKENELPEESNPTNEVNEPAMTYENISAQSLLPDYSIEEMKKRVDEGTREIREGNFLTNDELDDFILHDIPKDHLLQQIAQAEKDIKEGRLTTHEEMKKRFLK